MSEPYFNNSVPFLNYLGTSLALGHYAFFLQVVFYCFRV